MITSMRAICIFITGIIIFCLFLPYANAHKKKSSVVWQATFYGVMPNRKNISQAFCESHSPDVLKTTVQNILREGAIAKNKVKLKYNNYDQTTRNKLYFIDIHAIMSGIYQGKKWSQKVYIHQQKLTPKGITFAIWSSKDCKGFFKGEVINK